MVLVDDQAFASSVAADKSSSGLRQHLVKRAILKRVKKRDELYAGDLALGDTSKRSPLRVSLGF
jgi:hypothetical protein